MAMEDILFPLWVFRVLKKALLTFMDCEFCWEKITRNCDRQAIMYFSTGNATYKQIVFTKRNRYFFADEKLITMC